MYAFYTCVSAIECARGLIESFAGTRQWRLHIANYHARGLIRHTNESG